MTQGNKRVWSGSPCCPNVCSDTTARRLPLLPASLFHLASSQPSVSCSDLRCRRGGRLGKHRCLGKKLSLTSSDAGTADQPGLAHRPKRGDRGTFPDLAPVPDGAGKPVLPSVPAFHHSFPQLQSLTRLFCRAPTAADTALQSREPRSLAPVAQPAPGKGMEGSSNVT